MFQKDFKPVLRFLAMSDLHYKDGPCPEKERTERALDLAYQLSQSAENYKNLDALYVVGDFANSGSEAQMLSFKDTLDHHVKEGTEVTLMMASHEFNRSNGGEEAALEKFNRIFKMQPDVHKVINGFHFISETTTNGCDFSDEKIAWAKKELLSARKDAPQKPIFFFQHPHITNTVYGSIDWGEKELYPTLMDFPQVVDFSGHSHAPVNDPRSVYQKHFSAFGTDSMSYFELDEFDMVYGTVPPHCEKCAQMLFVEADEKGRVRVYPYDVLTENFFPFVWEIDEPWNPASFRYTEARYRTAAAPYFATGTALTTDNITENAFELKIPQAVADTEYVDYYKITVREKETGLIVKQTCIWSEYYFYEMPDAVFATLGDLESATCYSVEVKAYGFWNNPSEPIFTEIKTK